MRSYTSFTPFLIGALFTTLAACDTGTRDGETAATPPPPPRSWNDANAVKAEMESANDPKDTANSLYFRARPDDQGAFFVRRVNREVTACTDGQVLPECYVADIDTTQLQLDPRSNAELRAHVGDFLLRGDLAGSPSTLGILRVSEAWQGHAGQVATGTYLRATSTDLVCITYPCMSYVVARLNSDQPPMSVAGVNLDSIGMGGKDGYAQLHTPQGVLLAGDFSTITGPAGTAAAVQATEYYVPYTGARSDIACGSRGLPACPAGQFCKYQDGADCGRADQPGVCAIPPQVCTQEVITVCGCDGQTYSNACRAFAASTSVDYSGDCHI